MITLRKQESWNRQINTWSGSLSWSPMCKTTISSVNSSVWNNAWSGLRRPTIRSIWNLVGDVLLREVPID